MSRAFGRAGRGRPKDWLVVAARIPNHGAVEILDRGN
jgi:hypothetical protein